MEELEKLQKELEESGVKITTHLEHLLNDVVKSDVDLLNISLLLELTGEEIDNYLINKNFSSNRERYFELKNAIKGGTEIGFSISNIFGEDNNNK